jgi:hypothetical protein
MCMFCRSLFVPLYLFLLAIVLSVLLRYTDSDFPFGIFKLFLDVSDLNILAVLNDNVTLCNILMEIITYNSTK